MLTEILLVLGVVGVGILHTVVPDHWLPIAMLARQRGWTSAETARAAAMAGTGHVITTLLLGVLVWIVGATAAARLRADRRRRGQPCTHRLRPVDRVGRMARDGAWPRALALT